MPNKNEAVKAYQKRIEDGEKPFLYNRALMKAPKGIAKSEPVTMDNSAENYAALRKAMGGDANPYSGLIQTGLNIGGAVVGELYNDSSKLNQANRGLLAARADLDNTKAAELEARMKWQNGEKR